MSAARVRDIRRQLASADPATLERLLLLMEPESAPMTVTNAAEALACLRPLLIGHDVEHFVVVFLNKRHKVLATEVVSRGGIDHTVVDLKVIFRRALLHGAAAILVGHNHPSGDPVPSAADVQVTRRLVDAGGIIGIQVLDHIVVADHGHTSMAERGQLPTAKPW